MKPIILIITIIAVSSCTSSRIHTFNKSSRKSPYHRMMVVFCVGEYKMENFDEFSYDRLVKPVLNDIDSYLARNFINDTFHYNLGSSQTLILKSSELFEINTSISFDAFQEKADSVLAEAILFVNLRSFESSEYIMNGNTYYNSHGYFNNFLYDTRSDKIVWTSRNEIDGTLHANFNSHIRKLARKTYLELRKGQFIYKKQNVSRY